MPYKIHRREVFLTTIKEPHKQETNEWCGKSFPSIEKAKQWVMKIIDKECIDKDSSEEESVLPVEDRYSWQYNVKTYVFKVHDKARHSIITYTIAKECINVGMFEETKDAIRGTSRSFETRLVNKGSI